MTVKSFLAAWFMLLAEYEEGVISGSILTGSIHKGLLVAFQVCNSSAIRQCWSANARQAALM